MSNRPERLSKKIRRLSTDSEGTGTDQPDSRPASKRPQSRSGRGAAGKAIDAKTESQRSRRTASGNTSVATVERAPSSAYSKSASMRLTVKTTPVKLREATRTSSTMTSGTASSRDPFIGGEIIEGKRSRNVRKSYVLESDSDPEDEEDEDEDEEMEDAAEDDAEAEDDDEEMGDEDADADGDGDLDMETPPPPPVIKVSKAPTGKQIIAAKAAKIDTKTVEQKEVAENSDDDDDELSELDSDLGEEVDEEEAMQTGNEEDAEGEVEEAEIEEGDEEDDLDSDDETPAGGSRGSTPDLNKLTARQRSRLEEGGSGGLLALPDEVQVKKHLTAEEHAMRRAEMARRRKNLSEKRNEEEKMETINKLLKKQAPKTNARRGAMNAVPGDSTPDSEGQKANPLFVRWVSNKEGNRIGVPDEWLEGPVGAVFTNSVKQIKSGRLIEEIS